MEHKLFFDNGNGIVLSGIMNKPPETADKVIILAHGYGSHKNRPKYLRFAEEFEKRNIATFRFDFSGRGDSEGNFEDITISEGSNDVLKAIGLLKSKDFSRIGLIGVSFGGISSAIASSKTDDLKVLVLVCPVSDYVKKHILKFSEEGIKNWKETGYAQVEGKPLRYRFFEDAKNNIVYDVADRINAPTLIIHGTEDEMVPYEQSVKTSRIIKNCRLESIEGCDHGFSEKKHFEKMIRLAVDFVVENI